MNEPHDVTLGELRRWQAGCRLGDGGIYVWAREHTSDEMMRRMADAWFVAVGVSETGTPLFFRNSDPWKR